MMLYEREQPEAGPSSRPLPTESRRLRVNPSRPDPLRSRIEARLTEDGHSDARGRGKAPIRRQGVPADQSGSTSAAESSTASPTQASFSASTASTSFGTGTSSSPLFNGNSTANSYPTNSRSTYTTPSTSLTAASSSFSRPWQPSTRSTSSHSPESTPYVPGVILPLTLAGDSDDQAVYSVPMMFGHSSSSSRRMRRARTTWNGSGPQTVNLQVDLGSSDMWVASTTCTTSDCTSAPELFDASQSLDSGFNMTFNYQAGLASGDVYWEQIQLGGFGIGYQAFLAADDVENEDLGGGNFTGVLGLALPANSIILSQIAGSTSGAPDGATFLDNLFGSGLSAPTQRLFSLSLERREDVRTSSTLGIGAISEAYCPAASCTPIYVPIIPQPSLGLTGYLHWRMPLQGIVATNFSNPQSGTGATTQNITLGASQADSSSSTPLAVLDSGGVAILAGYKPWIDAIYGAFGVTASSDGLYRMPCTKQIALSFVIGGRTYPAHPLDMAWPDPQDPSQQTCIGAVQYSSSLGTAGDFILGSSFMKNVYSIFQYPDNVAKVIWQPTVGLVSVTNASVASQDFYAVRVKGQSLSDVSSNHEPGVGAPNPTATASTNQHSGTGVGAKKVLSSAGIAGVAVAGLLIFAVAVFCAWWFWLRRRYGKNGKVIYAQASGGEDNSSTIVSSSRTRKHDAAQRQKSMVEGISDYEDSWISGTEGGDSIRLGYMPEVVEEDNGAARPESSISSFARDPSPMGRSDASGAAEEAAEERDEITPVKSAAIFSTPLKTRRGSSTSRLSFAGDQDTSPTRYPSAYAYPTSSWSMAGPFPSSGRTSLLRPDSSPMYDIRSSDYFTAESRDGRKVSGSASTGKKDAGNGRTKSPGRMLSGASAEDPKESRQD